MASTSSSSSSSQSQTSNELSKDNKWYFTAEQLANSPSRRHDIDADTELSYRQLTAHLIQEMGQRLQVSQLCINTAIVYMHRFYAFHSFKHFHRNGIAATSLFLAAKVEEQPRKLEHVIKVVYMCLNQEAPNSTSEVYIEQAQDLVFNENVLLQTLGFDVNIDHPHTHVVKTCHLVKACKDLAQTSYFLASNSLHLTSMCLQYRPTVVACFCIYLACKWSRWEIPQSTEGKHWFYYVDKTVTMELLQQLTEEFLAIYEKSPARLKSKLNSIKALAEGARIAIPELSGSITGQLQTQLEPARRPENYQPSHHRSSTSSHHHSTKQHTPTNELGDYGKLPSLHKQPHGSHSNRPKPDRMSALPVDTSAALPPHAKTALLPPSSRPSTSRPQHASSSSTRPSHGTDASSYHKNRQTAPSSTGGAPQTVTGHKIHKNPDATQRHLVKDAAGRPIDPNKVSLKHSTSGSSSSSAFLPPSRNPQPLLANPTQPGSSLISRSAFPAHPNSLAPPSSNYSQSTSNRNTSSSGSNNIKYDQSVQQPSAHLQSQLKQSLESSYIRNSRPTEDSSRSNDMELCSPPKQVSYVQPSQQNFPSFQEPVQQLQQQLSTKPSSIFSPEWNDKPTPQQQSIISNLLVQPGSHPMNIQTSKPQTIVLSAKTSRDSPKKAAAMEKERRLETTKKDKIRNELLFQQQQNLLRQQQSDKKLSSNSGKKFYENPGLPLNMNTADFQQQQQQLDTRHGQQALNLSSSKRMFTASDSFLKTLPEELLSSRESKIRRLESPPLSHSLQAGMNQKSLPPYIFDPNNSTSSSLSEFKTSMTTMKAFPSTVHPIETNPDLVSSLLKESLCSNPSQPIASIKSEPIIVNTMSAPTIIPTNRFDDSKFLKQDDMLMMTPTVVSLEPPAQLFDIPVNTATATSAVKDERIPIPASNDTSDMLISKSEKKKKKEKHKNKEKDRSKDREEKKKHKKDKDKYRERNDDTASSSGIINEPFKIKISKDKYLIPASGNMHGLAGNPPPSTSGFKIKIPKDRIKAELNSYPGDGEPSGGYGGQPTLKIKISKDKYRNIQH